MDFVVRVGVAVLGVEAVAEDHRRDLGQVAAAGRERMRKLCETSKEKLGRGKRKEGLSPLQEAPRGPVCAARRERAQLQLRGAVVEQVAVAAPVLGLLLLIDTVPARGRREIELLLREVHLADHRVRARAASRDEARLQTPLESPTECASGANNPSLRRGHRYFDAGERAGPRGRAVGPLFPLQVPNKLSPEY